MIKAIGYRVLIKADPVETTTESGIILAIDEKRERVAQEYGEVIDIGPLAWKEINKNYSDEPWCKVGDRVVFSKYGGKLVIDPDTAQEYVILNDEDILAVVTEKTENE